MVCIRVCPFIGLSRYRVETVVASKPVSHMAQTNTSCSGCSWSLKLCSISWPCSSSALIRWRWRTASRPCSLNFSSSPASSLITTAICTACIYVTIFFSRAFSTSLGVSLILLRRAFSSSFHSRCTLSYSFTAVNLSTAMTMPLPK
ncbi:hypothetical protein D3C85_1494550 [compost metagenome]